MSCRSWCSEQDSPQILVSFSCFGSIVVFPGGKVTCGAQRDPREQGGACQIHLVPDYSLNSLKINLLPRVAPIGIFLAKEEI